MLHALFSHPMIVSRPGTGYRSGSTVTCCQHWRLKDLRTQLETICRVIEEDCDYAVDHVATGGSVTSDTAVRGHSDVILLIAMKEYDTAMVCAHVTVACHLCQLRGSLIASCIP